MWACLAEQVECSHTYHKSRGAAILSGVLVCGCREREGGVREKEEEE